MYNPIEYIIETDEELQELAREWIERLALHNYLINIRLARSFEMDDELFSGETKYNNKCLIAEIKLVKHIDYAGLFPHDMEQILVHELVHLALCPVVDNSNQSLTAVEQVVETISRALVQAKRDGMLIAGGDKDAIEVRKEQEGNIRKHK